MRKSLITACALVLITTGAFAGDDPKKMSPEEQAQMEAMMKAATPGDAHKKLDGMVGTWDAKVTMWNAPGQPPTQGSGTSVNRWVLGGRWVEQKFSGSFMGMPFEGLGYSGYDNIKKQYVGTWMDNMSTSVMTSSGGADANGNFTFTSSMDDPMTGEAMPVKQVAKIIDADHSIWEMWGPGPDGKMFKMMEIAYSRKK